MLHNVFWAAPDDAKAAGEEENGEGAPDTVEEIESETAANPSADGASEIVPDSQPGQAGADQAGADTTVDASSGQDGTAEIAPEPEQATTIDQASEATASPAESSGTIVGEGPYPWIASYSEGLDWGMDLDPVPLTEIFDSSVKQFGAKPCTSFLGKQMTYKQIGGLANKVARGLQGMGVGKGTKVGLFLPNTPICVIFYYGILKAGGTVVNYNPLYSIEELEFQVKDSETEIMVTLDLKILFEKVEALLASGTLPQAIVAPFPKLLPGVKSMLFKMVKGKELADIGKSEQAGKVTSLKKVIGNNGKYEPVEVNPAEDIAVLQYTGGTTGTPKGAMLTHANLSANVQQMSAWAPMLLPGEERMMGVLPFFHVFAMTTVMNFGLLRGAELILLPRFELKQAMKIIRKVRPTVMPGVPTLYNAMMQYPKLKKSDLESLKFCISGGAPLPLEIKRGFEEAAGCKLVEGYGLSETSPMATANPIDGPVREGSIGLPVPQTIVSIRSLDDPAVELPLGENGEICIFGPQVMKGYWNNPEETANVFVGDYLRTGDVGHMDDQGFIFIVDRLKDIILCSGYNVYPRRIEEATYEHPAVEEVTVVGIADEYRGEAPKAFIKLKEGTAATEEDIMEFLRPKLSRIEMPSQIEFRDELPKTMIGKLSKKELRQEEEAGGGEADADG